ncbi:MAG: hypothetical protein ACP5QT_00370 [Brevinematia bacterium]
MAGGNILNKLICFLSNIIWLNIKRAAYQSIWRILVFLINAMFFFLFCFKLSDFIYTYVFLITLFANILFVITRIQSEKDSIILLRSFGASKLFIIFDHLFQILLQIFMAFIVFIPAIPVIFFISKYFSPFSFYFFLIDVAFISLISSIYSLRTINSLEKESNL